MDVHAGLIGIQLSTFQFGMIHHLFGWEDTSHKSSYFFVNELIHLFTWTIFIHIPFIFPKDSKKIQILYFLAPPPHKTRPKVSLPPYCTIFHPLYDGNQIIVPVYFGLLRGFRYFLPLVSNDFKPGYH